VEVWRVVDNLAATRSADVIGRQLLRSPTSIGANIAEGHSRFTFGAYRNHLSIAKGSAGESESWIDLLSRLGLLAEPQAKELESRCARLMGAVTRRILALEQQEKTRRVREEGHHYHAPPAQVPWFAGSMVPDFEPEEDE
jgi:four helix bundle protein